MFRYKRGWAAAVLALVAIAWTAIGPGGVRTRPAQPIVAAAPVQQGINRAGVVVSFGDDAQTQCVSFSESFIMADVLLQRAGFSFETSYQGNIRLINGVGCPDDYFCYCTGAKADCQFWGYYHLTSSGWTRLLEIPSQHEVLDGDVEAWVWTEGNPSISVPPPAFTLDEICSPTGVTLTPTPTSTRPATVPPTSSAATVTPTSSAAMLTPSIAPEVVFQADSAQITAGSCTVLRWSARNADRVTLDNAAVSAQDQQNICPVATQRYVLVASNARGQTVRELTVQVMPAQTAATTATPVPSLTGVPPALTSPAAVPVATATSLVDPPLTPAPTLAVGALVFSGTATATPGLKALPAGATATALLRPVAPSTPLPTTAEIPGASSPQRLLVLAVGLLLGAGVLFAIGFRVFRHNAHPER